MSELFKRTGTHADVLLQRKRLPVSPRSGDYDSIRVSLPKRLYDPKIGAELYHRYFDEWQLADECRPRRDGQRAPPDRDQPQPVGAGGAGRRSRASRRRRASSCSATRSRTAAIRSASPKRWRWSTTIRAAASKSASCAACRTRSRRRTASPVRTADRLWEAHDLIVKAWTTHDGPFNWEGRFFHYRQVNMWPRPYQQPHPPIWITTTSPRQIERVADHGHTAATFLTGYDKTKTIFDVYRPQARARAADGRGPARLFRRWSTSATPTKRDSPARASSMW